MADSNQERIASLEQRLAKEPQSPLFARLASCYLEAGRAKDALRLCDDGLANFPFYATAHLIKGKALTNLGMMAEAKHEYEVIRELLPTNETVAKLYSGIELPAPPPHVKPLVEAKATAPPVVSVPHPPIAEEPKEVVVEETPPQEPVAAEAQPAPIEERSVQEPQAEEVAEVAQPEVTPVAEEGFGFGETPAIAPEPESPSAADKLGFEYKEEPQYDHGAPAEAPAPPAVEETTFGEQPPQDQTQEQPAFEPMQETPLQPSAEPAPAEVAPTNTDENPEWMEAFSQLQQPSGETVEAAPPSAPAEEENPFAMFETGQAEAPSAATEGEGYEEYSARIRMELFGTEDSMTLEEYLGQSGTPKAPPAPPDNIGDLAEKLKTSPRITPPVINFSEKAARAAGDGDMPDGSGIVTPTLAEIYVKQGWYDDAIKAYRALATSKPAEKEKYEQRIAEIEEMKKKQ